MLPLWLTILELLELNEVGGDWIFNPLNSGELHRPENETPEDNATVVRGETEILERDEQERAIDSDNDTIEWIETAKLGDWKMQRWRLYRATKNR